MSTELNELIPHTPEQWHAAKAIEFAGVIGYLSAICSNSADRIANDYFTGAELVSYLKEAVVKAEANFTEINEDPLKYQAKKYPDYRHPGAIKDNIPVIATLEEEVASNEQQMAAMEWDNIKIRKALRLLSERATKIDSNHSVKNK